MSETDRASKLYKRVSEGDSWYGPSLARLLADVPAGQAAAEPPAGSHTIWQIVLHVIAWRQIARGLLDGGSNTQLSDDDNWPAVADTSEAAWEALLHHLSESGIALQESMARFPDDRLDTPIPAYSRPGSPGVTHYQLVHGVMLHDVYHAGQIALLRNTLQHG